MAFGLMKLFLPLAALFGYSSAFNVAPTHVQVGLQAPTLPTIPLITGGPSAEALKLRQAGANNPICGWINGNGASAVSCGTNFYCATQQSFVGCCSTTRCPGIVTTCYDMLNKDICNAACKALVGNLVCGSTLPYCATYEYAGNSLGYGCAAASGFRVTVALSVTGSDGGSLSIPFTTSSSITSSTPVTSTTLLIATPTTITEQKKKDSIGAGAIAGIVIGSIATLVAAGAFIFWVITSHRKHREPKPPQEYRLSESTYGGPTQRSSTPGNYGFFKNEEPPGRSPMLDQASPSRMSAHGSEYGQSPRESYPLGYSGTPIAEMPVDTEYQKVGGS